jgi:hypothetical protein
VSYHTFQQLYTTMDRTDYDESSSYLSAVCGGTRSIPSGAAGDTSEEAANNAARVVVVVVDEELSIVPHAKTSWSPTQAMRRHTIHDLNHVVENDDSHSNNNEDDDDEKSHHERWHSHGKNGSTLCHRIVDWIQRIEIPIMTTKTPAGGSKRRRYYVPLISGLDHVIYGTAAAADVVVLFGLKKKPLPRYCFYMLSGALCDMMQFGVDSTLHHMHIIVDDSTCWAVGFFVSIAFRHTSHRYLVFGNYVGGYYRSLGRMYAAYSIIILLSTLFHILVTKGVVASFSHTSAWFLTLLWTGVANYFILKKIWNFGGGEAGQPAAADV